MANVVNENPEAAFQLEIISRDLAAIARTAAETDSLALFRVNFKGLSSQVGSLISAYGAGLDLSIYKAHCPMAFNNAGADWLQSDKTIANPYFGASMLGCGEITDQLSGADNESGEKSPTD